MLRSLAFVGVLVAGWCFSTRVSIAQTTAPATKPADGPEPVQAVFSADAKMKILLVGDSTVTEHAGWGVGFRHALTGGAEVVNLAKGGRSSLSYRTEGWWDKALALRPDYMLIQFGHNDQPGKGPERETDPNTTFPQNMARYVDEARAVGAKVALVTSLARRDWKDDGRIHCSLLPYAAATRRIAKEKQAPLIDLHPLSIAFYESLGRDEIAKLSPRKDDGGTDQTHLNAAGSERIGRLVAAELKAAVPELAIYMDVTPTTAPTDHAH